MNENQPISAAQAAAALIAHFSPDTVRVELVPQVSDGSGETRVRTQVVLHKQDGSFYTTQRNLHAAVYRVLRQVPGWDLLRPQAFDVATAEWLPPVPCPSPVVPLRLSPLAAPDLARDCARSLAEGHMDPPVWDDDADAAPERGTEGVPVQGGAL